MFRTSLLVLAASLTLTGTAFAQDKPNPVMRLDSNGDGQITRAEAEAMNRNPMALADADNDGTVTRAEVIAAATQLAASRAEARAGDMFDRFDEDGDGRIAVENLPEPKRGGDRVQRMFDRADANDDGVLSAEEIADLPEHGMRGHRGHDGKGGSRGDRG